MGVPALRRIGVGVLVDDRRGRPAAKHRVQVELFDFSPHRHAEGRDELEPRHLLAGVAAAAVPGDRDDDVLARVMQAVSLPEHGVGLADARS